MINLCAPAIVYLIFSITQILIDMFKGRYNIAFTKSIVTVMVTLLLNILCERGLHVVSWLIVLIPFIFMTVIVSIILYIFGLDTATGKINYKTNQTTDYSNNIMIDDLGNIIIYDPEYNSNKNPVYYRPPNIVVPNPSANNKLITSQFKTNKNNNFNNFFIPTGSSSPAYQS
jgi:hypothetical protein